MVVELFDLIGALVAIYVLYAVLTGEVVVKQGPGARRIHRNAAPRAYWLHVALYAALAVVVILVF